MRRPAISTIVAFSLTLGLAGLGGTTQASESALPSASHASVGRPTRMPYGWMDFCGRRPEECRVERLAPRDVHLTTSVWRLLGRVTRATNAAIAPVSNLEHWGTMLDHWDYPVDGKGDCKIYALEKRRLLLQAGLPRQALLMTIVRDLEGEGHAVLTVRTDRGDFVLDNLSDEVRPWDATGYRYVKRQAQEDPNVWVDLGGARDADERVAGREAKPAS